MTFSKNVCYAVFNMNFLQPVGHFGPGSMKCHLHGCFVDGDKVHLVLAKGEYCDRDGAIAFAKNIHPGNITRIITWSGLDLDIQYIASSEGWLVMRRPKKHMQGVPASGPVW